jgi:hypothetical protein
VRRLSSGRNYKFPNPSRRLAGAAIKVRNEASE